MKQNQWFAVRCCCTPKKIFGFIKLPAPVHAHLPEHRTLIDCYGRQHPIKLLSIYDRTGYCLSDYYRNARPPDAILEHTIPEIAIYSDDRPIEFWRTIPGFVEAPPEESS
jgi:hypothetical protein